MSIKQLRDDFRAYVAALSAVVSAGVTPAAVWVPELGDRGTIDATQIQVAPSARESSIEGRGVLSDLPRCQVAVYAPLGSDPDAAADAGQALAEAIIDNTLGRRIGGTANGICTSANQLVIADPEHWRNKRLFLTVTEFTFRV